jgi:hypothetical protein
MHNQQVNYGSWRFSNVAQQATQKLFVGTTTAKSCKSIRRLRLGEEDTQFFDSVVLEVDDNLRVENVDLKDIFLAAKEDIGSNSPLASVAKPLLSERRNAGVGCSTKQHSVT